MKKFASIVLSVCFILNQVSFAMPVALGNSGKAVMPVGVSLSNEGELEFYFTGSPSREERNGLIQMALDSFNTPKEELWVNLSANLSDGEILSYELWNTELGRAMLQGDVLLKERAKEAIASDPQLMEMAEEMFDEGDVAFRCWIEPGEVRLVRGADGAAIDKARLKVRVEVKGINNDVSKAFERRLSSILTKEANNSAEFASARQAFNAFLLGKSLRRIVREMGYESMFTQRFNTGKSEAFWKREYLLRYMRSYMEDEGVAGGVILRVPLPGDNDPQFGGTTILNIPGAVIKWLIDKVRGNKKTAGDDKFIPTEGKGGSPGEIGKTSKDVSEESKFTPTKGKGGSPGKIGKARVKLRFKKYNTDQLLNLIALKLMVERNGEEVLSYYSKAGRGLYAKHKNVSVEDILRELPGSDWMIENTLPWLRKVRVEEDSYKDFHRLVNKIYGVSIKTDESLLMQKFLENENWEKLIEGMDARKICMFIEAVEDLYNNNMDFVTNFGVKRLYRVLFSAKQRGQDIVIYLNAVIKVMLAQPGIVKLAKTLGYDWLERVLVGMNEEGINDYKQMDILLALAGYNRSPSEFLVEPEGVDSLVDRGYIKKDWLLDAVLEAKEHTPVLVEALFEFLDFYSEGGYEGYRIDIDEVKRIALKAAGTSEPYLFLNYARNFFKIKAENKDSRFLKDIDIKWIFEALDFTKGKWQAFFYMFNGDIQKAPVLMIMDKLGANNYQRLFAVESISLMDERHAVLSFLAREISPEEGERYPYSQDTIDTILNRDMLSSLFSEMEDGLIGFDSVVDMFAEKGLLKGELEKIFSDKAYRRKFYNALGTEGSFELLLKLILIDSMPQEKKEWLVDGFGCRDMLNFVLAMKDGQASNETLIQSTNYLIDISIEKNNALVKNMPIDILKRFLFKYGLHFYYFDSVLESLNELFSIEGEEAKSAQKELIDYAEDITNSLSPDEFIDFLSLLVFVAKNGMKVAKVRGGKLVNGFLLQKRLASYFKEGNALELSLILGDRDELHKFLQGFKASRSKSKEERMEEQEEGFEYPEIKNKELFRVGKELEEGIKISGVDISRADLWALLKILDEKLENILPRKQGHIINVIRIMALFLSRDIDGLFATFDKGLGVDKAEYKAVVSDLYKRFERISDEDKRAVVVATIFHDIGSQKGVRDFRHAEVGAEMVPKVLKDFEAQYGSSFIKNVQSIVRFHGVFSDIGAKHVFGENLMLPPEILLPVHFFDASSRIEGNIFTPDKVRRYESVAENRADFLKTKADFVKHRLVRMFIPLLFSDPDIDKNYTNSPILSELEKDIPRFNSNEFIEDWADKVRVYNPAFMFSLGQHSQNSYITLIKELDGIIDEHSPKLVDIDTDIDFVALITTDRDDLDKIIGEVSDYILRTGNIVLSEDYNDKTGRLRITINLSKMSKTAGGEAVANAMLKGQALSAVNKQTLLYGTDDVEQALLAEVKRKGLNEGIYPKLMSAIRNMKRDKDEKGLFLFGAGVDEVLKVVGVGEDLAEWLGEVMGDDAGPVIEAIKEEEGWDQVRATVEEIVKRKLDYKEGLLPLFKAYAIGVANGKIAVMDQKANRADDTEKGGIIYNVEVLSFK